MKVKVGSGGMVLARRDCGGRLRGLPGLGKGGARQRHCGIWTGLLLFAVGGGEGGGRGVVYMQCLRGFDAWRSLSRGRIVLE